MTEPIQNELRQAFKTAEGLYHRLILLVGTTGTGKTKILRDFAHGLSTDVINVNLALSAKLLELTNRQRALRLQKLLDQLTDTARSPVILDNLEILFDSGLKQDPLRLLQGISRNQAVIASWSGSVFGTNLMYAEPGHPEYRSYDSSEALIVALDSENQ